MSHVATIDLEIKDLDCLGKACQKIGVELVRDQKTFRHYAGRTSPCLHAIRVIGNANAYEIGVTAHGDERKGYVLNWDSWAGGFGLVDKVGAYGKKLKQEYAAQVATKQAQKLGYRVTRVQQPDGRIVLQAVR